MIKLRPLEKNDNDFDLLYKWCNEEFVYKWFEQKPLSKTEIIHKYTKKLEEGKQTLYIIQYQGKDIGYTQIYPYEKEKTIYEYDLFIGEKAFLNRGLGVKIIEVINEKISNDYKVGTYILRPFKRNIQAIKCYKKTGFKIIEEYEGINTIGEKEIIVVMKK